MGSWDYTQVMEDFVCLESFSYKLLKDENGSTKELMDGSCHDKQREEFHIDCPTSDCAFQIRTEIKYETVGGQNDTLDGFRIQVIRKNEVDLSVIETNTTHIEDLAEIGPGDFEIPQVDFLVSNVTENKIDAWKTMGVKSGEYKKAMHLPCFLYLTFAAV